MAILVDILQRMTRHQARTGSLEGCRVRLSPARAAELEAAMVWGCVRSLTTRPALVFGLPVEVDATVEDIEVWTPCPSRVRWVLPWRGPSEVLGISLASMTEERGRVSQRHQDALRYHSLTANDSPWGYGPGYVALRECARLEQREEPHATPLSGSGCYGQAIPREIPDTPLDEWIAGVDALLAAHDQWQAATDVVLEEGG